jgi:hypothetical protein
MQFWDTEDDFWKGEIEEERPRPPSYGPDRRRGPWTNYPDDWHDVRNARQAAEHAADLCRAQWFLNRVENVLYVFNQATGQWEPWDPPRRVPPGAVGYILRGGQLYRVTCAVGALVCTEVLVDLALECGIGAAAAIVPLSAMACLVLAAELGRTPPQPPPTTDPGTGQDMCEIARNFVMNFDVNHPHPTLDDIRQLLEALDFWEDNCSCPEALRSE